MSKIADRSADRDYVPTPRFQVQSNETHRWKVVGPSHASIVAAIARIKTCDPDGLFLPHYRVIDRTGTIVVTKASFISASRGGPRCQWGQS